MAIEGKQKDKPTNSVFPARELYKVPDNVSFRILVTNFPKHSVTIPQNIVDCSWHRAPESIIAYDELEFLATTKVSRFNFNELGVQMVEIELHQKVTTKDAN